MKPKCLAFKLVSDLCKAFFYNRPNGLVGRVFVNGPRNRGSIPGQVIPKTKKMVLDASNTQPYKAGIKGKVEQSRKRSSALPYTLVS